MFISEQYIFLIERSNEDWENIKKLQRVWQNHYHNAHWKNESKEKQKKIEEIIKKEMGKYGLSQEDMQRMANTKKEIKSDQDLNKLNKKVNERKKKGEIQDKLEGEKKQKERRERKDTNYQKKNSKEEEKKKEEKKEEEEKKFSATTMISTMWFMALLTTVTIKKSDKELLIEHLEKSDKIDKTLTNKIKRIYPDLNITVKIMKQFTGFFNDSSQNFFAVARGNLVGYTKDNTKKLTDNELIALLLAEYFYQNKIIKKMSLRTINILSGFAMCVLEFIYVEKKFGDEEQYTSKELGPYSIVQYFISLLFNMGGYKIEAEIEKIFKYKMKELKSIGYDKYYLSAVKKIGKSSLSLFKKRIEKKGYDEKDVKKLNKVIKNKHPREVISIIKKNKNFSKVKKLLR